MLPLRRRGWASTELKSFMKRRELLTRVTVISVIIFLLTGSIDMIFHFNKKVFLTIELITLISGIVAVVCIVGLLFSMANSGKKK
jgi:hypothetical protein